MNGNVKVPPPRNEPVFSYAPGTPERAALKEKVTEMSATQIDIPLIIGGEEIRTGDTLDVVMPHDHGHVLAKAHKAGPDEVKKAVAAAMDAHHDWSATRWEDRASIFLKAADLLAGPYRQILNASTMLGQSKTAHQAEIDAAAEMVDFFRMNVHFAEKIYNEQPISDPGMWNRSQYRALEGFVYAITPFNFTSIGGNLPSAPAVMGNTVVWKPARTAMLSNYYMAKLFQEAGVPAGVINFITGNSAAITEELLSHRDFGGVHFTGSTGVFNSFWKTIGNSVGSYKSYPRIVGETGGKDFIIAHPSADPEALTTAIVRGAFEYQGQKCSAASRIYVPESIWAQIKDTLVEQTDGIAMGDVADFSNFMAAVIDRAAFDKIKGYIDRAKKSSDAEIIAGGECDDSVGYFIRPTIILAKTASYESMCEEIFGPVVTVHVYKDKDWSETLRVLDTTSPYALTGAVFSQDRKAIREALDTLRNAAGNFYINDKPTGAVVGQQPFGGARASGTNDKAGSALNLLRWVSARTIKETFVPPKDYRYPFMGGK
ncbi:MAG TPA: L-glutamate gamma-semialdehyde dehydrogenase [Longimicrobiales bacterium]|nr:L-glutamate gamma-semialdehyde dehydrogenase [Longimicrobiales bacterium]